MNEAQAQQLAIDIAAICPVESITTYEDKYNIEDVVPEEYPHYSVERPEPQEFTQADVIEIKLVEQDFDIDKMEELLLTYELPRNVMNSSNEWCDIDGHTVTIYTNVC